MGCHSPLRGYWDGKGGKVQFSPSLSSKTRLELPCGRCIGCRLERGRQWAVRLMHEAQMHDFSVFVTLTYDDEHLPADRSVRKAVLQDFIRRTRRSLSFPIRFFGVGEYGELSFRPHYHALLFGVHFADQLCIRPAVDDRPALYRSPALEELWRFGHSSFGSVTFDSARYVAGYCVKKVSGKKAPEHYRRVDPLTGEVFELEPEFALMSRRPGIGANWFEKFGADVYPSDQVITNGHPGKPPRYYYKRLEAVDPERAEAVRLARVGRAYKYFEESMPPRLRAKAAVAEAKLKLRKRELS